MSFLADVQLRPVAVQDSTDGYRPVGLGIGSGPGGLEVVVLESTHEPTITDLRRIWKSRVGGRATPVLLVALHRDRVAICGPSGDPPPAFVNLEAERVERICRAALSEPTRHAALRFLHATLPDIEAPLAGLHNEGLFASHELAHGVPRRPDWQAASETARRILARRGTELLENLGLAVEPLAGPAKVLRASGTRVAVAVLLDRNETPETASERFSHLSPVSYALAKADEERVSWVVVLSGAAIRLYSAKTDAGVGRRGRTETYAEINLDVLDESNAGYLWLLFSGDALRDAGHVVSILARSRDFAADLGARLRTRIYEQVVPPLAEAILHARRLKKPTAEDLTLTYQMSLTLLFRLLFVAYAEDKELLPYRTNTQYELRSLKRKARELLEYSRNGGKFDSGTSQWEEVTRLFAAVDRGHPEWGVPAYNGGLFSSDGAISAAGAALGKIKVDNETFGPILSALFLDEGPEGLGPVDFRSLGVREFGTIYEGLLENELAIADVDLAIGAGDEYRPAKARDAVVVAKGKAYLHNAAGARKATGSYFTKHFAVEHLLNHALEPALVSHVARLDSLDDRAAAEAFFDFRVADIAMGSGHFLVAAVDRIERTLSSYLAKRPLPEVSRELTRLRGASHAAMGSLAESAEIEDARLLRRQIARHCVYGVDVNRIAVELARLSIWVHTFVPGLPLSFLDHNLLEGNSLVGIATIQEAADAIAERRGGLFAMTAEELVGPARAAIEKLARTSDADAAEIKIARQAFAEAKKAVAPAEALFDVLTAARIDDAVMKEVNFDRLHISMASLPSSKIRRLSRAVLEAVPPLHFPIAFPEVFLRDRAGFDVILGNPPWEEATIEEDRFWARYQPGFHSQSQREQESAKKSLRRRRPDLFAEFEREQARTELLRRVLTSGPFPGMGTGDPDVYKAFCWRFWQLVSRQGGRIGVVLPRSAFAARGSQEFRRAVLGDGRVRDLTTLLNSAGWVFEDVEPRYTIALASIEVDPPELGQTLPLRGPYRSRVRYDAGMHTDPTEFIVTDVLQWTDTAALPLLPSDESGEVFAQLRKAPRLDFDDGKTWRARPYAELHATNDKKLMKLTNDPPDGFWPVFKGESFDIWEADTGRYYAYADPDKVRPVLQDKRARSHGERSPYLGYDDDWRKNAVTLPCNFARVAFRDVSRATDTRTVRAALVPPRVFIANTAPYMLWPRGDEKDQAFLLGVLSSLTLDWYARRFVELHLNYHVLNAFPVPRPERTDPRWSRAVALAGRLACPDKRFSKWAKAVGVEVGKIDSSEKADMIAELDAVVAHLYGLSERQLAHVFETFHEGWAYSEPLAATLRHFSSWQGRS